MKPTRSHHLARLIGLLVLAAPNAAQAATVTRGPYLQLATPTSMVVRWRTDVPTNSRVRFGASPGDLSSVVDAATLSTEHEVTLTGLTPETKYHYAVGSSSETLAGGDAGHHFVTAPPAGASRPVRIWAFGDSGVPSVGQSVRNAYLAYTGDRRTDVWLMIGDNAYQRGTDAEFQAAVFQTFPTLLRSTVLWSARGNHERAVAGTIPFFDQHTFPKNGESGGVPSGSEAYYSFDHANVHFVVLDSYKSDRASGGVLDPAGPMLSWLEDDLAATTQTWIIALFHHAAYTNPCGSHNSDLWFDAGPEGGNSRDMREKAVPILEKYGADLVLGAHAHHYGRSYLIDGNYGVSATFEESMKKNGGDGREDGDGAYVKTAGPHGGTVYVLAGIRGKGKATPPASCQPAFHTMRYDQGTLVIDVEGGRLDAKFLQSTGAIGDSFTILKSATAVEPKSAPPVEPPFEPAPAAAGDGDSAGCRTAPGSSGLGGAALVLGLAWLAWRRRSRRSRRAGCAGASLCVAYRLRKRTWPAGPRQASTDTSTSG
jgi:hypothetical protein